MAKRPSTGASLLPRIRRVRTKAEIERTLGQVSKLEENRERELEPGRKRLAEIKAEQTRIETASNQIRARYNRVMDPRLDKIRDATVEDREELTAGRQSVDLATGALVFRLGSVAIVPDDLSEEVQGRIVSTLREKGLEDQFVRYLPKIDFAALRQRPEVYSTIDELEPERFERFSVIPAGLNVKFVTILGSGKWKREPLKK